MTGRTVLITGCSSGFGKRAAKAFQTRGWNVVATMRSPEKEIELANSETTMLTRLDVGNPDEIDAVVSATVDRFGSIDALVNNAGYGGFGLFEQASDTDIRAMFETNLFGAMEVRRTILPLMRRAGSGTIVNVTSMAGQMALLGIAVYSASKHALISLTEAMALEYKPLGIRIFSVAPSAYPTIRFTENTDKRVKAGDTELVAYSVRLREQINAVGEQMASQSGRVANPQEVANRIYACVTSDMPMHNPTGADADLLIDIMGQVDRQQFLDQIATMLVPSGPAATSEQGA